MVEVTLEDDAVVFNVKGWHKLWSFKSRLEIPRTHIRGVRRNPAAVKGWKGCRIPGTHVPGLIVAGTFHLDGKRIFWDVRHAENTVVVDLADEEYNQLIIEVENPDEVLELLGFADPSGEGVGAEAHTE